MRTIGARMPLGVMERHFWLLAIITEAEDGDEVCGLDLVAYANRDAMYDDFATGDGEGV